MHTRQLIAHDARQDAHDRIQQDQRRRLAAGENIVADRDLLELAPVDHPLVDAFETPADDDQRLARPQVARTRSCVSGRPRGLIRRRGRSLPVEA